jgi:hypothetical protein
MTRRSMGRADLSGVARNFRQSLITNRRDVLGLGSLVAFRVGRARRIGVTAVPGRVPHSSDVQTTGAWAFGAKKTLKSKGSEAEDVVARKPTSSA